MKSPLEATLAKVGSYADLPLFDKFRSRLPRSQITAALDKNNAASKRKRRLPREQVVLLVVAMALFRSLSLEEIVARLRLARPDATRGTIAPSAIPQARERLGEAPVRTLFKRLAPKAAHAQAQQATQRWRGLALYGIDGTTLRAPDSDDNRATFGGHRGRTGSGESGYPLVRLVVLMALTSHLLVAARFGTFATGEVTYAQRLWKAIPDDSLTLLDRAFLGAGLLVPLRHGGQNRHWMTRAKKNTKYKRLERLGPGDWRVQFTVSPKARTKDPTLPTTFEARVVSYRRKGYRAQKLVTSLLDPVAYPATELAALYHRRWELELGLAEIKTTLLERCETLRSKTVWGVRQEIWGLLLAYNLVREEMASVAKTAKVDPTRVSFVTMLRRLRDEWSWGAATDGQPLPPALQRLWDELVGLILRERRPERRYPRAVKIKMSKFKRKRPRLRPSPTRKNPTNSSRKAA
jgi:hypothetical protein